MVIAIDPIFGDFDLEQFDEAWGVDKEENVFREWPIINCKYCGGKLDINKKWRRRLFCSDKCATKYHHKKYIKKHNGKYKARRLTQLYRDWILIIKGNNCEVCGGSDNLHIHHKSYDMTSESKPKEILSKITLLCRSCHIKLHKQTNKAKLTQDLNKETSSNEDIQEFI